jgi:hypothetical protein
LTAINADRSIRDPGHAKNLGSELCFTLQA